VVGGGSRVVGSGGGPGSKRATSQGPGSISPSGGAGREYGDRRSDQTGNPAEAGRGGPSQGCRTARSGANPANDEGTADVASPVAARRRCFCSAWCRPMPHGRSRTGPWLWPRPRLRDWRSEPAGRRRFPQSGWGSGLVGRTRSLRPGLWPWRRSLRDLPVWPECAVGKHGGRRWPRRSWRRRSRLPWRTVRTRPRTMSSFAPRKNALSRSERRQNRGVVAGRFLNAGAG